MLQPRDPIEQRIYEFFEENFEALKQEIGHSLSPEVKELALHQVIMYWRKLHQVAERITDTEVRLSLPQQKTPKGRTFGIEGVVDIVREDDRVVMYDIKTHDAAAIRANIQDYERQLNVYAHIWMHLRGQPLDEAALICTQLPDTLKTAINIDDPKRINYELQRWNPLIDVPFAADHVSATIEDFGDVVDQIEEGAFAPATVAQLESPLPGMKANFAVNVCRECDARFSCASYRAYAQKSAGPIEQRFRLYFEDFGNEDERNARLLADANRV